MSIKEIILGCNAGKTESSIYSAKDEDGNDLIINLQKDAGAKVSRLQSNGWYEVKEYDKDGELVSTSYEK